MTGLVLYNAARRGHEATIMSTHVLISGMVFRAPEQRTGRTSGKNFVAATIKVRAVRRRNFGGCLPFQTPRKPSCCVNNHLAKIESLLERPSAK